jgi:thioredoxin reductase (NADPH)
MTSTETTDRSCTATEPTDKTASEPVIDPPGDDGYHVAVVGGGPAGCAASLFCARAGLRTLQLENGRSTLQKCAYVENYLGFPLGVEPRTLSALMDAHVERTDCDVRTTTVDSVRQVDDGVELCTDGETVRTRIVIAASWSSSDYLDDLGVETEQEPNGPVDEILTDDAGRTSVQNVYAAGRITGTHHQALVSAGDGARVALNVIGELLPEFYNDWVAPEGYYEHYDRAVPVGVEEISHEERRVRAERSRSWLCEFFAEESGGGW